ncbi:hypothetical protein LOY55_14740 [Pseudomonas sp. B21-040]|uniref:hypothetical protein n=1 Tax=Pseudomonas sp. B21-040 TaxID=2895486 RepID=UPI00215FA3FA|nr:hypothetical protein [Pseudomonas sp. B21-040]UVL43265.1 hypothetical protein LOY55_14740 [Pseudomonas sp. B21-040]
MDAVFHIQQLQLKFLKSASVNENCAIDLLAILHRLSAEETRNVLGIIDLLVNEAEVLRGLSKDVTANHFFVLSH